MKAKMKPLADKVLIRRIEEPEKKASGIVIPDTAKEKPQSIAGLAKFPEKEPHKKKTYDSVAY